ncbi:MAG: hypothetical protein J6B87_04810 [Clostridia bacterium]|nr:hypothetical protein [Clostridia bacterium]
MIKKLGLLVISCLFIFAIYNVYQNGLTFGMIDALSYAKIKSTNGTLNSKISELNKLNGAEYNSVKSRLESARQTFNTSKNSYDALAAGASSSEVAEANKREEFLLDYLWIKIGNYANANNIKVLIDPSNTSSAVEFDVSGPYISVINFIYDLENDSELSFNVNNIIMEGASNLSNTKAKFSVSGVNIITKEV